MSVVDVVKADLSYLRDSWNDKVTEDHLRRDAAVLRRLLVDRDLGKAWRADGHKGEPRIAVHANVGRMNHTVRRGLVWTSDGGAEFRGIRAAGMRLGPGKDGYPEVQPRLETLTLSNYVDGVVAIALGYSIKRREIIKYVANKLGGTHFDLSRKHDEVVFEALDAVLDVASIGAFSVVHWELLAVGQMVLRAPDISSWLPGGGLPPLEEWSSGPGQRFDERSLRDAEVVDTTDVAMTVEIDSMATQRAMRRMYQLRRP